MEKLKYKTMLGVFIITTLWSIWGAYNITLWFLEAGLCLVALVVLVATFRRFRFTDITYFFILVELIVLLIGAHYSYSQVPLFNWIKEVCEHSRNNYDKLGHFCQGFVPAFISREILIRRNVIRKPNWLPFFVICISLAISAFYELIEWWGALLVKESAEDFLGMQGYVWDTQSDMLMALIGSVCMLLFFSKWQDKQIRQISKK